MITNRCAGDFCETRGGEHPASATNGCNCGMSSGGLHPSEKGDDNTIKILEGLAGVEKGDRGGDKGGGGGGGGEGQVTDLEQHKSKGGEVDDVLGRRKHALSVETPRTVLFRLVSLRRFVFVCLVQRSNVFPGILRQVNFGRMGASHRQG